MILVPRSSEMQSVLFILLGKREREEEKNKVLQCILVL
jgi:hypothetical protein